MIVTKNNEVVELVNSQGMEVSIPIGGAAITKEIVDASNEPYESLADLRSWWGQRRDNVSESSDRVIRWRANNTSEIIESTEETPVERVTVGDDNIFNEAAQSIAVSTTPAWSPNGSYLIDDIRSYNDTVWLCIQNNTPNGDLNWSPDKAFSLWVRTWASDTIPIWKQPLGAHDAYRLGQGVYHTPTDRIWVSDVNANAFEPNSVADTWTLREDQEPLPPETDEWAVGVSYSVNDEVTYQGVTYRCIQVHTSIAGWQPPNVPALWEAVI